MNQKKNLQKAAMNESKKKEVMQNKLKEHKAILTAEGIKRKKSSG